MTLQTRLHLSGSASLLVTVALVTTVTWAASVADQVLAASQRAAVRAEAVQAVALALPALLLAPGEAEGPVAAARQALDRAGQVFGPGDGGEEVAQVRAAAEDLVRSLPVAAVTPRRLAELETHLLAPLSRLAARSRRGDAEASARSAEAITSARRLAAALAGVALAAALLGGLTITLRLRRGLAALETGVGRIGAGDLASRIALPGRDELASLGAALDAMAARLGDLMVSREQAAAQVDERTAELERARQESADRVAQLETVSIQLDASDRLVAADRLARGLTHELNNPLAILLADVEFASEELEAAAPAGDGSLDEVRAALGEARQAGRRIALIVRELMSFSRERAAGDRDLADLVETLGHAARLAAPEIRRHATFSAHLPPGPLLVQGNQARLGQAFLELLLGAASAAGGRADRAGRVSLSLAQRPGGAVVEVSDDGEPIPAELRTHLFDPFFVPVAGFTSGGARARGAGLGLASCAGIVQAAGGRIEVDSAAAGGTVFRVWLPAPGPVTRVALHGQAARRAGRARLLLLDADPFECAAAYRTLSKAFDVAPHASVSSALAALRAGERFDLILCDQATGPALAAALVADGSRQEEDLVLVGPTDGRPDAAIVPASAARLERPLSVEQVRVLLQRRGGAGGAA